MKMQCILNSFGICYLSQKKIKINGSPKQGDMIARNPENHDDLWLVSKKYFEENFEQEPSNYKKRLQDEYAELRSRSESLFYFIDRDSRYEKLTRIQQYLLRKQLLEMRDYLATLGKRIAIETLMLENKELSESLETNDKGLEIIGGFETFNYDEKQEVFEIKEQARRLIETIEKHGKNQRRKAMAFSDIEKGVMCAVKSLFT